MRYVGARLSLQHCTENDNTPESPNTRMKGPNENVLVDVELKELLPLEKCLQMP